MPALCRGRLALASFSHEEVHCSAMCPGSLELQPDVVGLSTMLAATSLEIGAVRPNAERERERERGRERERAKGRGRGRRRERVRERGRGGRTVSRKKEPLHTRFWAGEVIS